MTKKSIPTLTSDEEAEAFLDQDLTDYLDLDTFTEVRFEFLPKTKKVNLRVPEALLDVHFVNPAPVYLGVNHV